MSNARAAKRRIAKLAGDGAFAPKNTPTIELQNPVQEQFERFIFGNATICQRIPQHEGVCPKTEDGELADSACQVVVEEGSAAGQHLVLCGAGPSLAEHAAEWCPQGDQVWGCNSAVTWLHAQGHKVTHGFTVDQTPHMLAEWYKAPSHLEYLIATSCNPHLVDSLIKRGCRTRLFHNYVGIKKDPVDIDGRLIQFEHWMYQVFYPFMPMSGSGLNSVNRALDIAWFMGFDRVTVLGADCALRVSEPCPADAPVGSKRHREWLERCVIMHADGGHAMASGASMLTLDGEIDGRTWTTKPDMIVSAWWLVKEYRKHPGKLQIIGDTLPNALKDKDDEFLNRLPHLVDGDGNRM